MSCLVPGSSDAEDGVRLNCPVADSLMNRAPEETINRKSRGNNKKRTEDAMINESDNVDGWTDDGGEWM